MTFALLGGTAASEPVATTSLPAQSPDAAARQHIRHIEDNLLPAAFVAGESSQVTSLAAEMQHHGVPGVSMAFVHAGRIAWTETVGLRRIGGAPVDPNTVFQAASISKPVTAVAVMSMVESGELDLDRNVNDYLKSWKVPDASVARDQPITLRGLLSHTAGMSVEGFQGYAPGEPVPTLLQVLNGESPANSPPIHIVFTPGTTWSYSGGGYEIIQQLLADVTHEPFPAWVDARVLRPIGMGRSSFVQPLAADLRDNTATPYDANGKSIPHGAHTYPEQAAAGLWTTPTDLARFAINFQHSLAGQREGLLAQTTAREMITDVGLGSWGLGFRVGGSGEHRYFMHGGSNAGFRTILVAFAAGDGLIVMTNGDGGAAVVSALVRTVAAEYHWPEFQPSHHKLVRQTPAELDRFVGRYRIGVDTLATVAREADHLRFQIADGESTDLTPDGDLSFFSRSTSLLVTFRLGHDHHAAAAHIDSLGVSYDANRDH